MIKTLASKFSSKLAIAIVIASAFSSAANAANFDEGTKTIKNIGVQNATGYYFYVVEGTGSPCLFNALYVNADQKTMYATLLSAKLLNKKLSRVYYSQDRPGAKCTVELLEIE
ncbi:MAG: hypothetical protein EOP06_25525 [Proteobacteria bacterium]|nr:MAG: hypothetical protein EOP06_25525 [Pseudomonadota bacterium]